MELVNRLKNSSLIKDNLILFIGMMGTNVLGFVFHFYAGRKLGPSSYGILGAILSVFYYFTILLFSIQSGLAKFVSDFKVKLSYGKISYLFKHSLKKLFLFGLLLTFVFLVFVPYLARFLNVSGSSLYLLSCVIIFAFLAPIVRGILQGLQEFKSLSSVLWIEGVTKVVLVFVLLNIGLGVNGAIMAMILSWVVPLFFGLYVLRKFFSVKESSFEVKEIYAYTVPMLFMMLMLTSFYTLDVLFVKHFFDSVNAGLYAALALFGKILFFSSLSISQVMFPKVVEIRDKFLERRKLLFKSILMVVILVLPIVLVYFFFPKIIVGILFGSEYYGLIPLMGRFALFMSLYCLIYVISFYNIALKRYGFIFLLGLFVLLQGGLIYYYHSSLGQIVNILIVLMFVLFILLFVYTVCKK